MTDAVGTTEDGFLALFLDADDVSGMREVQDTRLQGPDAADTAFSAQGGLFAGFRVWMAEPADERWRLVDIRWALPSVGAATAYHRETVQANGEGHPAVFGAPLIGEGCTVFGGTEELPGVRDKTMTAYYYVFRVLNVVAKLFVAQGPELPAGSLTPASVAAVAARIESRIRTAAP